MELRKSITIVLTVIALLVCNNSTYGQSNDSPELYNAYHGITLRQNKELKLDSCIINSAIYNDSVRMDIMYYITNVSCSHPIRLLLPDFGWFNELSKDQIKNKKESLWNIFINGQQVNNKTIDFSREYNKYCIECERQNLTAELSWLLYNDQVDSINVLYGGVKVEDPYIIRRDYIVYPSKENEAAANNAIEQLKNQRKKYLNSIQPELKIDYSNTFAFWTFFKIGQTYEVHISYRTTACYNMELGMQKWFQYCFDEMKYLDCDESITMINIKFPSNDIVAIENLKPFDCHIDYGNSSLRCKIQGDSYNQIHDITFSYQLVSDKIETQRDPHPYIIKK